MLATALLVMGLVGYRPLGGCECGCGVHCPTIGMPYARFVCELEDPVVVETSAAFRMAAGEARYFELLHVHNDSVAGAGGAGALLGLSLAIAPLDGGAPFSTRVSGEHALSLEFFRVATREVPALPVRRARARRPRARRGGS